MASEQMECRQIGCSAKACQSANVFRRSLLPRFRLHQKEADLKSRKGNSARHEGGGGECGGLQLLGLVGGDGPGNAARLGSPAPLRCLRCQPLRSGFVARICKPKKISERTDRSSNACGNKCGEDSGQLLQAILVREIMSRGVWGCLGAPLRAMVASARSSGCATQRTIGVKT